MSIGMGRDQPTRQAQESPQNTSLKKLTTPPPRLQKEEDT